MKKGSLNLILICLAFLTNAQSPRVYKIPKGQSEDTAFVNRFRNKAFVDSLRNAMRFLQRPQNNAPLAGAMPRHSIYLRNNQKGFNIYQTPQDNMYILKPDSSFASNMPIAKGLDLSIKPVEIPNPKKEKKE